MTTFVDESDTAESGESYDLEMEARRILRSLPFSFEEDF